MLWYFFIFDCDVISLFYIFLVTVLFRKKESTTILGARDEDLIVRMASYIVVSLVHEIEHHFFLTSVLIFVW